MILVRHAAEVPSGLPDALTVDLCFTPSNTLRRMTLDIVLDGDPRSLQVDVIGFGADAEPVELPAESDVIDW
jgi:hypothetical protein